MTYIKIDKGTGAEIFFRLEEIVIIFYYGKTDAKFLNLYTGESHIVPYNDFNITDKSGKLLFSRTYDKDIVSYNFVNSKYKYHLRKNFLTKYDNSDNILWYRKVLSRRNNGFLMGENTVITIPDDRIMSFKDFMDEFIETGKLVYILFSLKYIKCFSLKNQERIRIFLLILVRIKIKLPKVMKEYIIKFLFPTRAEIIWVN